jgi:hypothetical protein
MKLIWYSPTYPGTRPEYSGKSELVGNRTAIAGGCIGLVASAFGRKLKSRVKVSYVGVAVLAACPVGTA